jgi:hypothetical protein
VKDLADVDAAADKLGSGRVEVEHGQLQILSRARCARSYVVTEDDTPSPAA